MKNKPRFVAYSWALYDFANTIYSMNVVSFYFPLWLTVDKGLPDIAYSLIYSLAIVLSAIVSPILGFLSDIWQNRKYPLILFTFLCVLFTAMMGFVSSPTLALSFFLIAHISFVLSLVVYNAMLPQVSIHSSTGKISGLGVGIGYVGSIVGLVVASQFTDGGFGRQAVFLPTAIMFLLFALPLFIWGPKGGETTLLKSRISFKAIWNWKSHHPKIRWFLIANFFCGDAVHTVILFMAVYARNVFSMSDEFITIFLIGSTLFALVGSFFWGELTTRKGATFCYKIVLWIWLGIFIMGALTPTGWMVWVVGAFVGIALSGTWVTSRVLIVDFSPSERVGEYFGLYNLTGKSAAIIGPLYWGALLLLLSPLGTVKYRITLFSLSLFIILALLAMRQMERVKTE